MSRLFEHLNAESKTVKSFAVLLRPGKTHAFAGWIVHGYTIIGPNTLGSWVVGGGCSNVYGLDYVNSFLALKMWVATKGWTTAEINFKQMKRLNQVLQQTTLVGQLSQTRPKLLKSLLYMGLYMGRGSQVTIWLNKLAGRKGGLSLVDANTPVKVREVGLESIDLDTLVNTEPIGDKSFTGVVHKMSEAQAKDLISENMKANMS
jgi:hypothetical protein